MKKYYDVVVVGAGTSGAYFAKRLSENGFSVLVVDKTPEDKLGSRLEIFHIDEELFERFGVPKPQPGDDDYVTLFKYGLMRSPFGNYEKRTDYPFLVMRLPLFLKRLTNWAKSFGAEYAFDTEFTGYIFDDGGKIGGVKLSSHGEKIEIKCRLVADCSGMASVARRALPDNYGIEKFDISPRDKFYVILQYITLDNPERDKVNTTTTYPYYKSWIAPQPNRDGAILGVGANLSYEFAEKCFAQFKNDIKLPPHTVDRIEKGTTPYRRPPYSFVADGFVVLGDAACITKPYSGEGITAAWVLCDIAAANAAKALSNGQYPSKESLWNINVEYNRNQGANFAELMTTLIGAVDCTREEMEYEFKKSLVFDNKIMTRMNRLFANKLTVGESLSTVTKALGGVVCGEIRGSTISNLITAVFDSAKIKTLYKRYPDNPENFKKWTTKADKMWQKIGTMADKCKP